MHKGVFSSVQTFCGAARSASEWAGALEKEVFEWAGEISRSGEKDTGMEKGVARELRNPLTTNNFPKTDRGLCC
jgi:hypothetical protein